MNDKLEAIIERAAGAELTREAAQAVVSALGAKLGLGDLPLDADGSVELVLDDDVFLTLTHLPGLPSLIAGAPLLELHTVRGDLFRYLLKANMLEGLTAGGVFGIAPDDDTVSFSRQIVVADGDLARIEHELGAFATQVTTWTDQLELYLDALDEDDDEPAAQPSANSSRDRAIGLIKV